MGRRVHPLKSIGRACLAKNTDVRIPGCFTVPLAGAADRFPISKQGSAYLIHELVLLVDHRQLFDEIIAVALLTIEQVAE